MNAIKQWFISKGGLAHVLAAAFAFLMLAYGTVPQFHALVLSIHQALPGWLQELVTTAFALWAFYKTWNGGNPTQPPSGVATGQKIAGVAILIAVGIGMAAMTGCKTTSTNPPTAPSVTALNVLQEVQSDVLAVQQAEISAVKSGLIDRATDVAFQKAFVQEAQDATALADAISTTASQTTVQAKVTTLLNDIQQDVANGVAGIKDANTKAAITASVSAAEIAVNSIMAAYNAGK